MTLKHIKEVVSDIEKIREDDEEAHGKEDDLYRDFVKYIARTGTKEQKEKAKEILKTSNIEFARWYA